MAESRESLNDADLRLTIFGCFRYSLGRMTYMPGHTVKVIMEQEHLFNENDWRMMVREIDSAKNLGHKCDVDTWNRLKAFALERYTK